MVRSGIAVPATIVSVVIDMIAILVLVLVVMMPVVAMVTVVVLPVAVIMMVMVVVVVTATMMVIVVVLSIPSRLVACITTTGTRVPLSALPRGLVDRDEPCLGSKGLKHDGCQQVEKQVLPANDDRDDEQRRSEPGVRRD